MKKQQKNNALNILVVEDDPYFRQLVSTQLEKYGSVDQAGDYDGACSMMADNHYDVAFFDLNLSSDNKKEGVGLVKKAVQAQIYPIVLTSAEDEATIKQVYRLGCRHYFHKGTFGENIDHHVGHYLRGLASDEVEEFFKQEFLTSSASLKQSIKALRYRDLSFEQKIFITGPTGVGKTTVARLIHKLSGGSDDNFVHLNLAELPENLLESQLFGHKKGSFTDAKEEFEGFLSKANGGTLFLDEVAAIPLSLQKKLLRVIERGEYTPLGSTEVRRSKYRLISATCEDLGKLIQEEKFRADFYFRIKGIELYISSLKERPEDIPLLLNYFMNQSARKVVISDQALRVLTDYDWFGNVRELEHLTMAFKQNTKGIVELADLPEYILRNKNPFRPGADARYYTKTVSNYISKHGLPAYIKLIEIEALKNTLSKTEGRITKAQEWLKIPSRNTIYRMKKLLEESDHARE